MSRKLLYITTGIILGGAFLYASTAFGFGVYPYVLGGTGTTTAPEGQVLYGGATAYQSSATGTETCTSPVSCTSFTILGTGGSITDTADTFAYPFTPTTFGINVSGTSTPLLDYPGVIAATSTLGKLTASSTLNLGFITTAGGLAISTNGNVYEAATTTLSTITGSLNLGSQVTGTLPILNGGTNATSYASNVLIGYNGTSFIATGTPQLTVGNFLATSTTATSTTDYGLNVAVQGGCLAVNGTCLSNSTNYWTLNGNNIYNNNNSNLGFVGIGTTSPFSIFGIQATTTFAPLESIWTATSSTASTTITQTFTTSGTWTKPPGLVQAVITVIGGGGGGGGSTHGGGGGGGSSAFGTQVIADGGGGGGSQGAATGISGGAGADTAGSGGLGGVGDGSGSGGGGGGGGSQAVSTIAAGSLSSTVTITIGQGGGGGASTAGAGGAGYTNGATGLTSAGNYYGGGGGGSTGSASGQTGGTGASVGTVTAGSNGSSSNGGGGGNSGSGATGGAGGDPGNVGGNYGAGGGGANDQTSTGGAGAPGEVIVVSEVNTQSSPSYSLSTTTAFFLGYTSTTSVSGGSLGNLISTSTPAVGIGTSTLPATFNIESYWGDAIEQISAFIAGTFYPIIEKIDQYGHLITGGPAPSCGTGCSSVTGDDRTMNIVTNSAVTAITVNFANTWTTSPACTVDEENGGDAALGASTTPSTLVITSATSLTAKNINAVCQTSVNFTY